MKLAEAYNNDNTIILGEWCQSNQTNKILQSTLFGVGPGRSSFAPVAILAILAKTCSASAVSAHRSSMIQIPHGAQHVNRIAPLATREPLEREPSSHRSPCGAGVLHGDFLYIYYMYMCMYNIYYTHIYIYTHPIYTTY